MSRAEVAVQVLERSADDESLDVAKAAKQSAPPWLVSMAVHLVLVMALALFQFSDVIKPELLILASYSETLGEQLLDDSITSNAVDSNALEAALSVDANPVDDPLASMPELDIKLPGAASVVSFDAPSIGIALTGREKGAKSALLAAYGGNSQTESAVGMALEWLRKNQQRDGSWSLSGPYADGVTVENVTGATAMALLAFQGSGSTHREGPHQAVVKKGIAALLKLQDKDGNFFREGVSGHRLYSQAMATIVVCELYGMTRDPAMKEPAELALRYAAKIQASDGQGGGGWRYQPGADVDTSVTGWFVMALQSARMAGLEADQKVLDRVSLYLDHVTKDGTRYHYRIDEEEKLSMTAEALLCRQYLGWKRNDPRLRAGVSLLLQNKVNWDNPNFYYWYYATQVLHHVGGADWFMWNEDLRAALPTAQEKSGKEKGSWSPAGDEFGYQGGRLYSTCFCTFMLEVYYRHLPIYGSQE